MRPPARPARGRTARPRRPGDAPAASASAVAPPGPDDLAGARLARPRDLRDEADIEPTPEAPRVQPQGPVLHRCQLGADEDRVRLPAERGTEQPVIGPGHDSTDLRRRGNQTHPGALGDVPEGRHAAPGSELWQCPLGELLET